MTAAQVLMLLLRRWPVLLAGLTMTSVVVAVVGPGRDVYSTQTDVLFLAPQSARAPNPIESSSEALIATAGLVSRMVTSGVPAPATASTVSLTSQGVRKGYSIELPDTGGQWAASFDRPVLVVQVAGPSEAWVRSTLSAQMDRIDEALHTLQAKDGVSRRNAIVTSSAPRLAAVDHASGDRKRVVAGTVLLGGILTVLAVIGVERAVLRRRRPHASGPHPERTDVT